MAHATTTPSTPLGQALTRKRRNLIPSLLIGIGIVIALVFAGLGYLESQRTESVVVLVRDVPYGRQIVAEDLTTVELPFHRPNQLSGVRRPDTVIGMYATRNLSSDDLIRPEMLQNTPPDQPVYPNGETLAPNMVPVPFATSGIGPISYRDRVNIGFNDPSGAPDLCNAALRAAAGSNPTTSLPASVPAQPRPYACRLLSSVRVLYVDHGQGVAFLEMTPYQSHTIWALQAAGLQLWGERYGSTSDELPVLDRLDIGQVNREALISRPAADEPQPAGDLPGAPSILPGADAQP
jgi:hypothetical protein